jgi:hypothetical protein
MEEWKPVPIQSPQGYLWLVSFLVVAALVRWSPRRFTPTEVLLLASFGLETLLHARVFVWWTIVVIWVALPHAQAVLRQSRAAPRPAERRALWKAALAAALALGLLAVSAPGRGPCLARGRIRSDPSLT